MKTRLFVIALIATILSSAFQVGAVSADGPTSMVPLRGGTGGRSVQIGGKNTNLEVAFGKEFVAANGSRWYFTTVSARANNPVNVQTTLYWMNGQSAGAKGHAFTLTTQGWYYAEGASNGAYLSGVDIVVNGNRTKLSWNRDLTGLPGPSANVSMSGGRTWLDFKNTTSRVLYSRYGIPFPQGANIFVDLGRQDFSLYASQTNRSVKAFYASYWPVTPPSPLP